MNSFEKRLANFNEYSSGQMEQTTSEAFLAYQAIRQIEPEIFVEIGSRDGGSFYVYAGACKVGATIICVDKLKKGKALTAIVEKLKGEGYDAHWIRGNSCLPATVEKVKELFRGRSIGFLHIDSDHSAKGVTADWNAYSPLTHGLIALHDIALHYGKASIYKAWPTLREKGRMWCEIFGPPWKGGKAGIGLVWRE